MVKRNMEMYDITVRSRSRVITILASIDEFSSILSQHGLVGRRTRTLPHTLPRVPRDPNWSGPIQGAREARAAGDGHRDRGVRRRADWRRDRPSTT